MKRPIFYLSLLVLLTACSTSSAGTATSDKLQVVATHSILGDMVRNVSGDAIALTVLVGPDGDAHTFEPSPTNLTTLAKADLIFENGLGFEPWMDDLYTSSGANARRVVVSETIDPLTFDNHHEEEEAHEDEDEHGEQDPHVWHDVSNAIAMTEVIRDALIEQDAANTTIYEANAEVYLRQLEELDAYVRQQVETIPPEHRKLVTSHDTFSYFARAYGFEIVGTALGATTGDIDPSAGEIAALVDEIRGAGVPTIFAENIANTELMAQIASEADVRLGPPLYTDALGQPGTEGASYITMMRYNIEALADVLR